MPTAGEDWNLPLPDVMPRPTYAPAILSLGVVFIFWGLITTVGISLIGLILFVAGLTWWIGELRHELRQPRTEPGAEHGD